ncbi:MAG: DUF3737 family protein [Clostridia bacterium]|nr:DUF3737 family protein [Clostridia bacterium]
MAENGIVRDALLTGERALFMSRGLKIYDSIFDDGESPLKESCDIELYRSMFKWKYPLWYCRNVKAVDCSWFEMARAGVWYSEDLYIDGAVIEAPKNFRRCRELEIRNADMVNAQETLWSCRSVTLDSVSAKGDYFAMNSGEMTIRDLRLVGNYPFDGGYDINITDSRLLSKDAFWNCRNVTVKDSFISGEYLGWNSENLTFENCIIESLQGMCYINGLKMKNCRLLNTTLAFEYSSVEADIDSSIDSVLNPSSGKITCDSIGELIVEKDRVDPSKTVIVCRKGQ